MPEATSKQRTDEIRSTISRWDRADARDYLATMSSEQLDHVAVAAGVPDSQPRIPRSAFITAILNAIRGAGH